MRVVPDNDNMESSQFLKQVVGEAFGLKYLDLSEQWAVYFRCLVLLMYHRA